MNDWGFCSNGRNLKNLPKKVNYSLSCKQKTVKFVCLQITIWRLMHGCQKTFFFFVWRLIFWYPIVDGISWATRKLARTPKLSKKKKIDTIMRGPNMNYSKFLKVVSFLTFRAYLLTQSNSLQIALISLILSWSNHVLVYLCRR